SRGSARADPVTILEQSPLDSFLPPQQNPQKSSEQAHLQASAPDATARPKPNYARLQVRRLPQFLRPTDPSLAILLQACQSPGDACFCRAPARCLPALRAGFPPPASRRVPHLLF